MSATINDERTPEQKAQTMGLIVATDRHMSGWGNAPGRSLLAVPYASRQQAVIVEDNMRHRSEMQRVRRVGPNYRPRMYAGDNLTILPLDPAAPFSRPSWFAIMTLEREIAQA